MTKRWLLRVLVGSLPALLCCSIKTRASASDPGVVGAHAIPGGATVVVESHTRVTAPGVSAPRARASGPPRYTHCDTRPPGGLGYLNYLVSSNLLHGARPQPGTSEILHHSCTRADGSSASWFTTPAPGLPAPAPTPPSALDLARRAAADLHPPAPDVRTSPPGLQLVGFPTWFWIDNWAPVSSTAAIPNLRSTATARPTTVTFTFDGGATLRCDGPGTAWRKGGGPDQHSDCTHTFTMHGRHRVDVAVTWTFTWTSTNGTRGPMPDVARRRTLTLVAQEGQAVID